MFANKELLCLAEYDYANQIWKCQQRPNPELTFGINWYTIHKNGVYAIIFNPKMNESFKSKDAYCGYICQDKRFLISLLMTLVPFLALGVSMFYKL